MNQELIAPCGMNCAICSGYLALEYNMKNKGIRMPYCEGCRPRDKKCAFLKKKCRIIMNNEVRFCYQCKIFPCENLLHLDRRYVTYFRMNMIENLKTIKMRGVSELLKREDEKWNCPKCGGVICCHNGICFNCGLDELRKKKKTCRWDK